MLAFIFIQDYADFLDEQSDKVVKLGVNTLCNPAKSLCSASIVNNREFQRIGFNLQDLSKSGTKGQEFSILVTAKGFDFEGIQSLTVAFEAHGQDLDNNLVVLSPDKSENLVVPERWQATAMLPETENTVKSWVAVVRLKSSKKDYKAEFPFSVK
jgi:hypothetical protein